MQRYSALTNFFTSGSPQGVYFWLTTRYAKARVRAVTGRLLFGPKRRVLRGAPQRTCPEPLVFVITLIVLAERLPKETLQRLRIEFSDDSQIKISADDYPSAERDLQRCPDIVAGCPAACGASGQSRCGRACGEREPRLSAQFEEV